MITNNSIMTVYFEVCNNLNNNQNRYGKSINYGIFTITIENQTNEFNQKIRRRNNGERKVQKVI